MTLEDDENIPLGPLNEIIQKFRRRMRAMNLIMLLSLPAALVAIVLFLTFAFAIGFSSSSIFVFFFLIFSAAVSLIAIMFMPDLLYAIVDQMEATAEIISFTLTPPKGESPEERALNQLMRTDYRSKRVVKKKPSSAQLNARGEGKSGKEKTFEVYVHNENPLGRFFDIRSDMNVYVKRYDNPSPVDKETVKEVKEAVQDSLRKVGRRMPDRVLIISTSGFDETAFEYARSKEGIFKARFSSYTCGIELIKENVDHSFDVLSF